MSRDHRDGCSCEWCDVAEAYAHGQDGGAFVLQDSSVSTPTEIAHLKTTMPRAWLVTLGALEPHGGIVGGDAGSVDRELIAQLGLMALVQWGTGNAMETALVDWPIGGCTFAVNGRQVRLFAQHEPFVLTAGTIRPQASGFIAPSTHGRTFVTPPTFTTDAQTTDLTAAGNFMDFEVPKRARAYRLTGWLDATNTGGVGTMRIPFDAANMVVDNMTMTVKQLAAVTNDVESDIVIAGAQPVATQQRTPGRGQLSDAGAWIPLNPATTRIRALVTQDGDNVIGDIKMAIQFALDLG